MKSDHDLDTAVTEGSLAVIRERYSIPIEYGLHVPQPGQRPYSLDALDMCISVDALEADLRFPLHPLIEECLRLDWSAHPIGNAFPYLSEEETILVDRLKGILSSSRAIKEMVELWLVEAGLSPASRDRMDLGELREMPKVTSGKVPPTRPTARDVSASLAREAPKASLKRSVVTPTEQAEDAARRHKKVKVLTRRHKSHLGEGESHSRSKGKEPAAPPEEPEAPTESEEGGASSAHQHPRSMKDLFKIKVHKDDTGYYTLLMSDLGHQDPEKEMKARWKGLKNSTKVWNNSSAAEEFERGLLHPQLARELYTLPSEVLMARAAKEMVLAVAKAKERTSELREELEKTKRERGEELLRREASEKELHEVQSHLGDAQRLLKEARVRARKMDDELLQAMKALESARAELPRHSIVQYNESLGFKEGLKRMSGVTYEYGYRVALARFHARHPDAEVEEVHPKDDLVPMERQQAFDDSVPPEP
ncbi:hypothetical protein B296_00041982 [Ensete ventricosum]|uniref:Uncharacterized protein n=1 Tax=Ensete ventricosum TaxID=4639 RepID=A0A426XTI3_ENSVE|nr:hypothetical protein B296_00041982 [Ensete ventricosum]